MTYNNQRAQRVRTYLAGRKAVTEQPMMGSLIFMLHDKMCFRVINDDLMVRIDPARREELLAKPGCRPMDFTHRRPKGFVFVESTAIKESAALAFWLEVGLSCNRQAKSYKNK